MTLFIRSTTDASLERLYHVALQLELAGHQRDLRLHLRAGDLREGLVVAGDAELGVGRIAGADGDLGDGSVLVANGEVVLGAVRAVQVAVGHAGGDLVHPLRGQLRREPLLDLGAPLRAQVLHGLGHRRLPTWFPFDRSPGPVACVCYVPVCDGDYNSNVRCLSDPVKVNPRKTGR